MSPKCCACQGKCNSSSENYTKVLRLPHKMIFDTFADTWECHELVTPLTQNHVTTGCETLKQDRFCSFPHRHGEATGKPETRDETCWSIKTSISCEIPPIFTLCSFRIDVFLRVFLWNLVNFKIFYLKSDVSCEASVNFQHISQSARPATEFARCHHLRQPWQCDSQKTRNTTPLKCCACHAKWRRSRPKCCACHEN